MLESGACPPRCAHIRVSLMAHPRMSVRIRACVKTSASRTNISRKARRIRAVEVHVRGCEGASAHIRAHPQTSGPACRHPREGVAHPRMLVRIRASS